MIYFFKVHTPRCNTNYWNQGYDCKNFVTGGNFYSRVIRDYSSDIANPWFKALGYMRKGQLFLFKANNSYMADLFDYTKIG